jgi:hypothetical protein
MMKEIAVGLGIFALGGIAVEGYHRRKAVGRASRRAYSRAKAMLKAVRSKGKARR